MLLDCGRVERVDFGEALRMIVQLRAGCAMNVLGIGELMEKLLLGVRQVHGVLGQCREYVLREEEGKKRKTE